MTTAELSLEGTRGGFWVLARIGFNTNVSIRGFSKDTSGERAIVLSFNQDIEKGYCLILFLFPGKLNPFMDGIKALVEFLCRVTAGGTAVTQTRSEGRIGDGAKTILLPVSAMTFKDHLLIVSERHVYGHRISHSTWPF